jgi:hypothetical protein
MEEKTLFFLTANHSLLYEKVSLANHNKTITKINKTIKIITWLAREELSFIIITIFKPFVHQRSLAS